MLDQERLGNLIKSLHLAVNYTRIYPPTSQLVMATIENLHKLITSETDSEGSLTFSHLSGKLLVGNKESSIKEVQLTANNILRLMGQRSIQSISFKKGLTKEILNEFISSIVRLKKEEFPSLPNIKLDETMYVAVIKGEEAVVKISQIVNEAGGDIAGLMKSMRESYDLIDKLQEPSEKEQAQEQLAKELAKQNPTVLKEIFDRELPFKIEESGLKKMLLNNLSQDKIQSIFGEISVWFEEIRKNETSDFSAVEQLEKLKYFIQTILQSPGAKELPKHFFEELLRKGLLAELPEWFARDTSKPTTVYEVEKLLEKQSIELTTPENSKDLPKLIEKLCQIENDDLIGKLVDKMLENLKNTAPKIRLSCAQTLASSYDVLHTNGKEKIMRYMELPVYEADKIETSPDVDYYLVEILRLRAKKNLLLGEYELSTRIIDLFKQRTFNEIVPDPKIRTNAERAFNNLAQEVMDIVVSDLISDNDKKRIYGIHMLSKFGAASIESLIKVIKESTDPRNRRLAAIGLKNLGETARKRYEDELNLGLTPEEMKRVVESLAELGSQDTAVKLGEIMRFPDQEVKVNILKYLAKTNTPQARLLVIQALNDDSPQALSEAIRIAGELKIKEAMPGLITLFNSRKTPIKVLEEIAIAFANIEDYQAVSSLIWKLRKSFSLFTKYDTENERIRIRSVWALRRFSGPDVEYALEKASKDRSAAVAMTAKESLSIIRSKTVRTEKH